MLTELLNPVQKWISREILCQFGGSYFSVGSMEAEKSLFLVASRGATHFLREWRRNYHRSNGFPVVTSVSLVPATYNVSGVVICL